MGVARLIRRTAPLIVVGLAAATAAKRRAERIRRAQLMPGPFPPPVASADPVVEAEPEPVPEPEPEPEPEPDPVTEEIELAPLPDEPERAPPPEEPEVHEPASVTEIVDDLLAPGGEGERIEDATVVEGSVEEDDPPPDDRALAEAVRAALAEQEGLVEGTVEVDVEDGAVLLRGEVERVEAITELERRAAEVPGIRSVKSFVHLPGTPAPASGEHR